VRIAAKNGLVWRRRTSDGREPTRLGNGSRFWGAVRDVFEDAWGLPPKRSRMMLPRALANSTQIHQVFVAVTQDAPRTDRTHWRPTLQRILGLRISRSPVLAQGPGRTTRGFARSVGQAENPLLS
jgi:hypothetical protein